MKIKTRFAPSPTGYLHVGGARTAFYSWLFARNLGGEFILRIEDTDLVRSTPEAIKEIMESMRWLKLNWDKGPYFQTQRLNRYNIVIEETLAKGFSYRCYCSKERLKKLRETQIACGEKPRYDGRCRDSRIYYGSNTPCVVRFKNPTEGSVIFDDLIRGSITFQNKELDDLIIRRSDGSPTYNFCVVVDDFDMEITHVIRGEDHINNTPRQINILKALGAPLPKYAHVSMILGSDGKKLSKRHGAVGVLQYRNDGFLPEALLNCLVRMGWSFGNQEIFSIDTMKKLFKIKAVSKSAAVFNFKKLLWLNHYYINHLSAEYVSTHLFWHINQQKIDIRTGPKLSELVKILRKHCKTLKEMATSCRYFYEDFIDFNENSAKEYLHPVTIKVLLALRVKLEEIPEWTPSVIRETFKNVANELQVGISEVCMPLRVAVTGVTKSPALDVTIHAIGQSRSLARINLALNFINKNSAKKYK